MRKIRLTSMFLDRSTRLNHEITGRKTLLACAWFIGSATLTFTIVYFCTIAPMANRHSLPPTPSNRTNNSQADYY